MPTPTPIDSGATTEDDRSTRYGYETDGAAPSAALETTEGDDE